MSTARIDLILRQLDALPALPAVAAGILKATAAEQPDAKAVTRLVESDPAIAARVLQAARRAEAGVHAVADVERAVVRLGFVEVRNIVLALGVVRAMQGSGPDVGDDEGAFSRGEFWRHCLAVACAAELLAPRVKTHTVAPGEAFCCGLLHDLGKLALHATLPKAYARVVRAAQSLRCDITRVEQEVLGLDHAAAGRRLCERWNLPETVRDVAWLHNALPQAVNCGDSAPMVHLVTLADQLARQLHLGFSGNHAFGVPRDALLRALGLNAAAVKACFERIVPEVRSRGDLLDLGGVDEPGLYRRAIMAADLQVRQADAELAAARQALRQAKQDADRLATDRRRDLARLQDQADSYATLQKLAAQLRPDADAKDVLASIASVATATLAKGAREVVAFSLPLDADTTAEVLHWADGKVSRFDVAENAIRPEPTHKPRAWPGDLQWMLDAVPDALRGDDRQWLPLLYDNATIGGVAWQGEPADPASAGPVAAGWTLALALAQQRESQRTLNTQLADSNRRLGDAREQMARDRSIVAMAELAGGAAHEMNNPLMVISGRSQLLYRELTQPRLRNAALAVYHNAGRLADMVEGLMRFARPDTAKAKPITPAALVEESLKLLAAGLEDEEKPLARRIRLDLPEHLPAVRADPSQWTRAIAAVLENAVQAVADGEGDVTVSAAVDLGGRSVRLTIADRGEGMDEATLSRAFDPFFSNKSAGRRRGMGLPIALRLVETAEGRLTLDSREGEGTRATFTIPVAARQTRRAA
jgi:signal transduction histidine kinase/HD-like signal output (HDOD) protein